MFRLYYIIKLNNKIEKHIKYKIYYIYITFTKTMSIQQFLTYKPILKNQLLVIEGGNDDKDDDAENVSQLLEPYRNNELIPISIINNLVKYSFKSCEFLHDYSSYHKIIKVKISDLLSANITNWKYNRPADLTRCADIARYIYITKTIVDTMLYVSFNKQKCSFDVIDGIHRYTSLKIIQEENSKALDLITPSEFGNNNDAKWLYDSYILINIRINSSEGELIELFRSLNKSNPIPELYVRDLNQEKREIIESVSNNWQVKYKSHFSSNSKPNKPNVNRDRFIDLLEIVYDKYKITNENKFLLEEKLQKTNTNILFNIPRKLSQSIKEKCSKTGLWMFIYTIEELIKMI